MLRDVVVAFVAAAVVLLLLLPVLLGIGEKADVVADGSANKKNAVRVENLSLIGV